MSWSGARNKELMERARAVLPNGMYGHESVMMMPEDFPQFFQKAQGTRLWDVDGNEYIDYMCAYGPNLMGYGRPEVQSAIGAQLAMGDTMTGPGAGIVELAETFVSMVKHADWALFCKNGGDATSIAMVTARAYKGRKKILVARGAYHGSAPWNTPSMSGIVPDDRAHIIYFDYNDVDSVTKAAKFAGDDVAAIFATPFKHDTFTDQADVNAEYARGVRALCDEIDALLIIDDVRAGFRLARGCSWDTVGVEPDIACFGKVIGNGQPISAVLGSDKARKAIESIFVTGSFWFSAVPMAAALATLKLVRDTDYLEQMVKIGTMFRTGLDAQAADFGFALRQTGPVQMPLVMFHDDPDFRFGYEWCRQAMLHGVYLSPYHNMFMNAAMTEADVALTLEATGKAFDYLKANRSTIEPQAKLGVLKRLMAS
jgi:glutamate-1-semialdehyde 2,1-aminomutase